MIGMMNGGADVPIEFYGGRPQSKKVGKKGAAKQMYDRKKMLHEKISYAKDGRMLVDGKLTAANKLLSPPEMWEDLMMRVMCRAVCETYMKTPKPRKKRFSDYLPWRQHKRETAAVTAVANAAEAVRECRTRKDSTSSSKSSKTTLKTSGSEKKLTLNDKIVGKFTDEHSLKKKNAKKETNVFKRFTSKDKQSKKSVSSESSNASACDNLTLCSSSESTDIERSSKIISKKCQNKSLIAEKSSSSEYVLTIENSTIIDNKKPSMCTSIHNKKALKISRNTTPTTDSTEIVRCVSSTSLKSPCAIEKIEVSPSPKNCRPLSISTLSTLTSRATNSLLPSSGTSKSAQISPIKHATNIQQQQTLEPCQPLHSSSKSISSTQNATSNSIFSSRIFSKTGDLVKSATKSSSPSINLRRTNFVK